MARGWKWRISLVPYRVSSAGTFSVHSRDFAFLFPVEGNKTDVFFSPLKTRFIRVTITENHGGNDIRIQGIGFYGVDMRLVELLRAYGLERSLQTLLANVRGGALTVNEAFDVRVGHQWSRDTRRKTRRDFEFIRRLKLPQIRRYFCCFVKDKYLDVNDHFQFIRLTESLRSMYWSTNVDFRLRDRVSLSLSSTETDQSAMV